MPGLNESCRKCGKDANDACSGCKDALYCSRSCQKWDWKTGGHKVLCRGPYTNREMNKVIRELFAAEWTWLQGLSFADKMRLFEEEVVVDGTPMNHLFISGAVALVLARGNACATLRGTYQMRYEEYGFDYYENVLEPWYLKNMDFLSQQGFFVELITRPVYVSDSGCQECVFPCGNLSDLHGGSCALVKDTRSPKIGLVNRVFGMERSRSLAEWTEEEKSLKMNDLLDCVTFRPSREGTEETGSTVVYYFSHPNQVFGGARLCCSPCFKVPFNVDPSDADAVGNHFHECYQALAQVGFLIEFLLVHVNDWEDRAVAEAWWAASGKNMSVFQGWFDDGTVLLSNRLSKERRGNIYDIVLELGD